MAKNKRTVVRFRVNMLFTGDDVSFEEKNVEGRLEEMRWLKEQGVFR